MRIFEGSARQELFGAIMPKAGRFTHYISAGLLCAVVAGVPGSALAATVEAFLISNQTAPAQGATAPFSFTTTNVYQLQLNGNKKAASARPVDNFTFDVSGSLTFNSQSDMLSGSGVGPVNATEYDRFANNNLGTATYEEGARNDDATASQPYGTPSAAYVNAEVGAWDDAFIDNGGADTAALNLDMDRNTWVTFNPVSGGVTDLVIAEVGALTPLALSLCSDASCTTSQSIFAGFTSSLASSLADMPQFTADEDGAGAGELDQTFVFRFSEPVYDYLRIFEVGDRNFFTGERLEIDFLGVGSVASDDDDDSTVSAVPLPAGLPMLVAGLGLLGWASRRRTA